MKVKSEDHLDLYPVLVILVGISSGAFFFSSGGWIGVLASSIILLTLLVLYELILGILE